MHGFACTRLTFFDSEHFYSSEIALKIITFSCSRSKTYKKQVLTVLSDPNTVMLLQRHSEKCKTK